MGLVIRNMLKTYFPHNDWSHLMYLLKYTTKKHLDQGPNCLFTVFETYLLTE